MSAAIQRLDLLFAIKGLVASGLAIAGLRLLWLEFRDRTRPVRINRPVTPQPQVLTQVFKRAPADVLETQRSEAQLARLAAVIQGATRQLDTITTAQSSASVQIDAAEHSFNRLIDDVKDLIGAERKPATRAMPNANIQPLPVKRQVTPSIAAA